MKTALPLERKNVQGRLEDDTASVHVGRRWHGLAYDGLQALLRFRSLNHSGELFPHDSRLLVPVCNLSPVVCNLLVV